MAGTKLNLRGLKCPLPTLKTRKVLTGLTSGDELVIECTDPLTGIDIPNLLRQTGDHLLDTQAQEEVIVFRVRKQ
jgi:tRNA 2-thiouridine synthesizing protein A